MRRPNLYVSLVLCAAIALPAAASASSGWFTSLAEATEAARESERDILVDLYADWCLWCSKLDENVFSRSEFQETLGDRYVFLRVDVEQEEGGELQRRFRAGNLPTTLLMTPDQVEIGRVAGYFPVEPFLRHINAQEESYAAFLARYEAESGSTDSDILARLARDLYERGDGLKAAALYQKLLPRTEAGSPERARMAYEVAESLRRGGALDDAEQAYATAREALESTETEDTDLAARLHLLRFHIDHDRGECLEAVGALEQFLERYPRNPLASPARTTLHRLRQSESCA